MSVAPEPVDPDADPPDRPTPFDAADRPATSEVRPGSRELTDPAAASRPRGGLFGRLRRNRPKSGEPRPATKETKPKRSRSTGRRTSAVDDFSDVAMWAGDYFSQRSGYRATGHAISMNASVSAYMLDDAVKNTIVDRLAVQPVVRNRERVEKAMVVVEIPLIVNAIERGLLMPGQTREGADEIMRRWGPRLRRAVQRALPLMVPAIRKVRQREAELAEAARELYPDLPQIEGEDAIDAIMRELLAPLFETGPEQNTAGQPAPSEGAQSGG